MRMSRQGLCDDIGIAEILIVDDERMIRAGAAGIGKTEMLLRRILRAAMLGWRDKSRFAGREQLSELTEEYQRTASHPPA